MSVPKLYIERSGKILRDSFHESAFFNFSMKLSKFSELQTTFWGVNCLCLFVAGSREPQIGSRFFQNRIFIVN